jgi:hypothetical protein
MTFFAIFAVLSILVRYRHAATWFICPFSTIFAFYYCSRVRLDDDKITQEFSVTIILATSFFLLVIFNEVWLISSATFGPLIAFTIWQAGSEMTGTKEGEELVIRVFWCIICYSTVGYSLERARK